MQSTLTHELKPIYQELYNKYSDLFNEDQFAVIFGKAVERNDSLNAISGDVHSLIFKLICKENF